VVAATGHSDRKPHGRKYKEKRANAAKRLSDRVYGQTYREKMMDRFKRVDSAIISAIRDNPKLLNILPDIPDSSLEKIYRVDSSDDPDHETKLTHPEILELSEILIK
jgi:hypothetical protein